MPTFLKDNAAPIAVANVGIVPNLSIILVNNPSKSEANDTTFFTKSVLINFCQNYSAVADKVLIRPLILSTIASFSFKAEPSASSRLPSTLSICL